MSRSRRTCKAGSAPPERCRNGATQNSVTDGPPPVVGGAVMSGGSPKSVVLSNGSPPPVVSVGRVELVVVVLAGVLEQAAKTITSDSSISPENQWCLLSIFFPPIPF